jgi:exodeoxyribonuclease V gamma subunit
MPGKGKVFLSNQLDLLADALAQNLFSSTLFEKRLVIVPNEKLKRFLFEHIARKFSIAAGLQVVTLYQAAREWFSLPSQATLSLRLEYEIKQLQKQAPFEPLFSYLEKEQMEGKLGSFADALAEIFLRYQLLRALPEVEWQKALWRRVCSPPVTSASFDPVCHLFAFNFLPKLYLDFFDTSGTQFYCLSPCALFWEDLRTDRERVYIQNALKGEEESHLEDPHPLLSNLGKVGRLFLRALEDRETEELYREPEGESQLQELQRSFLNLSLPSEKQDGSIQVHAVPSKLREVEVLLETLHQLLDGKDLTPSDVLVVAVDINAYAPYIHMVFGSADSKLDYRIYDLEIHSDLQVLLDIPAERFGVAALFKLFSLPAFLQKMGLSEGDVSLFKRWVHKAHIRWGMDAEQRAIFLGKQLVDESAAGTWEQGFERMLWGLAFLPQEEELSSVLPCVEFSEAQLLGTWISLVRQLKADLEPLYDGKERSLSEWCALIKKLADRYLGLSLELTDLDLKDLEKPIFPYSSFYRGLKTVLSSKKGTFQPNHLQSVTFCSAVSTPSRVLCVLGMEEESFPRKERKSSLYASSQTLPSREAQDRYLFLEWILSAQEHLMISYQNVSARDHKPQGPSIPLQELMSALSLQPTSHTSLARTYHSVPLPVPLPLPDLLPLPLSIPLHHLTQLARHPIQFYFNRSLQLYLQEESPENPEFHCSYREKARLTKKTLKLPFEPLWKAAEEKGLLPSGVFKQLAYDQVREQAEDLQGYLKSWGVEETFSVELTTLHVPLKDGRTVSIVGTLSEVSARGLLFHGEDTLKDLLKAWPSFLVFLSLKLGEPKLLLTKDGSVKEAPLGDPLELLARYIEYYESALNKMSPLLPEWSKALLLGTSEDLEKAMSSKYQPFSDVYLEWLARRGEALPSFEMWATELRTRFTSFIEWSQT